MVSVNAIVGLALCLPGCGHARSGDEVTNARSEKADQPVARNGREAPPEDQSAQATVQVAGQDVAASTGAPVQEVDFMPEAAKALLNWKHPDPAHHRRMAHSNYGLYSTREQMFGWSSVAWWAQVFDETSSRDCHDVALANLIVGRFDTALTILEKRLAGAPASDPLRPALVALAGHARRVKHVLTESRDALRRQQPKLEYPDESIFLGVRFKDADEFLALNVSDAHLAAHPTSPAALRRAGDLSLRVTEADFVQPTRTTNVPTERRKCAAFWGQTVLEELHRLDPADTFPIVRMMAHELSRPEPRGLDQPLFKGIFKGFAERTDFTKAEKGLLRYGSAMLLLKQKDGWEQPVAHVVIQRLTEATQWDPDEKTYATTLEQVRANKDRIDQAMLSRRAAQTRESVHLNELLRRGNGSNAGGAMEHPVWPVLRAVSALELENIKRKDPDRAKRMEEGPCLFCFGSGNDWALGGRCPACLGTGRFNGGKK